jgi:FAD/FMN-containing dehydrogenase
MPPTIDELRERVRGQVITPGDAEYDAARRVYNAMIDRRPAVVVRCMDAADVMAGVDFARDTGAELSVRGGSHSVPGFGTNDGGVVVDLSGMRSVRVDPHTLTARAEGGCTWGDLDHATHAFGLATTGGIVSTTGVGGLTLGGGIGYLARRFGLTLDNLESVDVVTAEGRQVVASDKAHDDLFWAVRGGGGNFGVVTSFEYQLHPVRDVVAGLFFFPVERAGDVLDFYRSFIDTAPEEMAAYPAFHLAPPLPFIPPEEHGKPFCVIVACWSGPLDRGERAMEPIRRAAPLVAERVSTVPYPAMNALFDELLPPGMQHYWKTAFATELTDGAIRAHLEYGPLVPAVNTAVHMYPIDGACHRVPADATAFANRDAKLAMVIAGMWPDPADNERNVAWVRDYYRALAPHAMPGGYVNFMASDDQPRVHDSYGGNYARLAAVKRAYDPDNLFHLNQNIPPAS